MASKVFVVFVIVTIIGLMVSEISALDIPLLSAIKKDNYYSFPSFSSLFSFLGWGTDTAVTPERQESKKCVPGKKQVAILDNNCNTWFVDKMYQDETYFQFCHLDYHDAFHMLESPKLEKQGSRKCVPGKIQVAVFEENCSIWFIDQMHQDEIIQAMRLQLCHSNNPDKPVQDSTA